MICIHKPEKIRGGGFLKYCHLQHLGWGHLARNVAQKRRQRDLMATRFCIDFPDDIRAWRAIRGYLQSHFWGKKEEMVLYLHTVRRIFSGTNVPNKVIVLLLIEGLIQQTGNKMLRGMRNRT